MEVNRTEKITFRCTALEKAALAEQAARCGISTSEYCRTLALGGRPKERYTEEERELFREIARLKGTLQRLNNYFWKIQCKLPPKTKRFCPLVLK